MPIRLQTVYGCFRPTMTVESCNKDRKAYKSLKYLQSGFLQKKNVWGARMVLSVKHLPSARVMIPGSWVQALHWAP